MIDSPAAPLTKPRFDMTPITSPRWWEFVKRGQIHCNAHPFGHHFAERFHVSESGFIRCAKLVPAIDEDLFRLSILRDKGLHRDAERWTIALRSRGVDVPSEGELASLIRMAPKRPCDRWIFLYAIRGGGIVTAEVSPNEKSEMEELSTPTEMMEYLQILRP